MTDDKQPPPVRLSPARQDSVLAASDMAAVTAAIRAMVAAAPLPMAVFDASGVCCAANPAFALRASLPRQSGETRTQFSPDAVAQWTLVTTAPSEVGATATEFLNLVADSLPVMFNAKDTQSRYLFMNRYQAEMYGVTPEGALGRDIGQILGPELGAAIDVIDAHVVATAAALPPYEETYATADGVIRHWLTSKAPLLRDDGNVWGIATVSIDITERNALERDLRAAKEQAEAASTSKTRFLAAMSHELRTPLNAVIGFAGILHSQALGSIGVPEYLDYAGHILRSGEHLLHVINDILDLARVESGGLRINFAPVDLAAMVSEVVTGLAGAAEAGGVRLDLDLPLPHPIVQGDPLRLRQALQNIAGNAIKFTPPGGWVALSLGALPRGGAIVTITDSGIGIAEANKAQVFTPFFQADSGLDRSREGIGIGLPLAREIITMHGGKLELESRIGEGTQVTITLPA